MRRDDVQMSLQQRLARVVRDELKQRYASRDDQAEAMAAAVLDELGPVREWGYNDPRDKDPEPSGWYTEAPDYDAEERAQTNVERWGGTLFSRYVLPWEVEQ